MRPARSGTGRAALAGRAALRELRFARAKERRAPEPFPERRSAPPPTAGPGRAAARKGSAASRETSSGPLAPPQDERTAAGDGGGRVSGSWIDGEDRIFGGIHAARPGKPRSALRNLHLVRAERPAEPFPRAFEECFLARPRPEEPRFLLFRGRREHALLLAFRVEPPGDLSPPPGLVPFDVRPHRAAGKDEESKRAGV